MFLLLFKISLFCTKSKPILAKIGPRNNKKNFSLMNYSFLGTFSSYFFVNVFHFLNAFFVINVWDYFTSNVFKTYIYGSDHIEVNCKLKVDCWPKVVSMENKIWAAQILIYLELTSCHNSHIDTWSEPTSESILKFKSGQVKKLKTFHKQQAMNLTNRDNN